MANQAEFNMHVFRDGRREVSGRALLDGLAAELAALSSAPYGERRRRLLLSALLRAGELECILADQRARDAGRLAQLTDALADALVHGDAPPGSGLAGAVRGVEVPAIVRVRPPEGFAYYALHPLDYAALAAEVPLEGDGRPVRVVGLRSIGTTLSAAVAAAFRRRGVPAERITTRPEGHPYDRKARFVDSDLRWVRAGIDAGAAFFVVDEGPGLSGSSLLSVGDALVEAGVPRGRITLLCSHAPDPDALLAPDGARRFRAFQSRAITASARLPEDATVSLGGGAWRAHLSADEDRWPASWVTFERLKFLSPGGASGGARLFKFEGLGRYGAEVRDRAEWIHRAGFGLPPRDEGNGYVSHPWLPGPLVTADDLDRDVINRLADYCVFRARAFPAPAGGGRELVGMVRDNCAAALGAPLEPGFSLETRFPVIADAHMMPHEWRRAANGELIKVDGLAHGDDHFFPGPTDIAWDLAGAIVEWQMSLEARRAFLDRYRRLSGDRPDARLPAYIFAYTLYRLAYTTMAASALRGSSEEPRLLRERLRYLALVANREPRPGRVYALSSDT